MRLALAAIVSAATTLGFGASTPAQAGILKLILHEDAGFEGGYRILDALDPEHPDLAWFSDKTSSIVNNDWSAWVLYDDKNYQDRRYCIRSGETVPNLSSPQWKFNDKISSARRLNTRSCAGYPTFYTTS
ncbi:beta/gamma crystallin family protein [Microbispora sp. NBC_01189]|uniref:beta/gamma crystallin-related protein n=1 Tax=Microbispora sp. NBC_01189 TaxID=2903583 RepID=UPI002E11BB77|nr:beta/gamma crystallin family protein [Microbispora sp. NBC_01189]